MKISILEVESRHTVRSLQLPITIALVVLVALATTRAYSQSPGLLWSTNVGATLFAIDEQTNIYASVGGSVVRLNANGVPLQTNSICPIPGIAQCDAAGNFYFAGNFDGTQNFGGITLVGGWTNWPTSGHWTPGYPTHYVAKYTTNGSLLWVTSFGEQSGINMRVTDFLLDLNGGVLVGHLGISGVAKVTRLNTNGVFQWTAPPAGGLGPDTAMKLGGLTSSNFCLYRINGGTINAFRRDYNGNGVGIGSGAYLTLQPTSNDGINANPVIDDQAQLFVVGRTNSQQLLCKFSLSGPLVWAKPIPISVQWTLARDVTASVYCGATDGALVKYDVNGNEIWTASYSNKVTKMLVDASGNRFLNFADGGIARLGPDVALQPPSILVGPQNQIAPLGIDATFSVTASGSPALYYQWRKDGTNLIGATFTNHTVTGITSNHVGSYDVVVTNLYGSVTSTPPAALLVSPSLLAPFSGTVGIWGRETTLSVSAWGSGTLTYQWYKSGQLVDGATNSTLIFPSLQFSDGGLYTVVISSAYGSVTNTPAQLVVNPANISLNLYAGITIDGTVGYTYGIEYTTNLQDTNAWQSLTNITLSQPVEIWVDTSVPAPANPKRYYRVTGQ